MKRISEEHNREFRKPFAICILTDLDAKYTKKMAHF